MLTFFIAGLLLSLVPLSTSITWERTASRPETGLLIPSVNVSCPAPAARLATVSRWRYDLGMNSRLLVIAAGLCLLIPAWIGLFSSGVPTLYGPLPTLTILPAFVLSRWQLQSLAVIVPSILFFLWNPGLVINQQPKLPKRTVILLGLLTGLTVVDCVLEWKYGVEYRGMRHTILVYAINAVWLASLWYTVVRSQRQPSFKSNLFSHWLLFAWLAWYAFPYLGELP